RPRAPEKVVPPDLAEKGAARADLPGMRGEVGQQLELLEREIHQPSLQANLEAFPIDGDVAAADELRGLGLDRMGEPPDAGSELGRRAGRHDEVGRAATPVEVREVRGLEHDEEARVAFAPELA